MSNKIAGVVVLYNPDVDNVIKNINSYLSSLDVLYVVDNSDFTVSSQLSQYLDSNPKIEYIVFGQNLGIARALNEGASRAVSVGCEWLLTMDQDSTATSEMVPKLYDFIQSGKVNNIGIVAASPQIYECQKMPKHDYQIVKTVFTSGNLMNLTAYKNVGGFDNELFIDFVDCIFCLTLLSLNYKIVMLNNVRITHNLGDTKRHSVLGIKILTTNHNHIRRYYITRNRFYMYHRFYKSFPKFVIRDMINNVNDIVKIILFEKDKKRKLYSVYRGWCDYKKDKYGKSNL